MYFNTYLVYTWGNIYHKGSNIYKQAQPFVQPGQNISSLSCGHSHITAVDAYGDVFVLGSN
jgi:alpha-tubulin suppressor-like RCC1 family protein